MKIKKLTALAMTTAMCAATIFGCGSSSDSNDGKETTTAASAENPTKVNLLVWTPQEDQTEGWIQKMCDQFNADHPEWDITFEYGVCGEGDAGKNVTQDVTAAADVYMFANDQLTTLINADAIAKLGGTVADYVKETNTENVVASVTYDGNIYGLPFTGNTWFMYYNKSIFTEDDVKSLESMLAKGKVAFPIGNSWYFPASFFAAVGGTFSGADGTDEAAGIVLGDKAADVTKYLVDLVKNPNFVKDDAGSGMAGLGDGSIGAIFSGTWDYNNVVAAIGEENVGICQLPTINVGGTDYSLKSFAGSKAIGVNPNCENMEVAVALAKYLAGEEAQQSHYEMRSIVPCNTKLLANDTVSSDPLVKAQADTIANTSIVQPLDATFSSNYWDNATAFSNSILDGTITVDNAAEKTTELENAFNGK